MLPRDDGSLVLCSIPVAMLTHVVSSCRPHGSPRTTWKCALGSLTNLGETSFLTLRAELRSQKKKNASALLRQACARAFTRQLQSIWSIDNSLPFHLQTNSATLQEAHCTRSGRQQVRRLPLLRITSRPLFSLPSLHARRRSYQTMSTTASSTSSSSSSSNNTTPCRHTPSRRVVRTLNGEQLSISIPDNFHQQHHHLTQHWQQQQQQQFQQQPGSVNSMMVSPALPSPNFSNFMLTLSPLMQLSSPQPTMSPRDDMSATGGVPSNMYVHDYEPMTPGRLSNCTSHFLA